MSMLRTIATTLPFRACVAFFCLWCHVVAIEKLAEDRFGLEWQKPLASEPHFYEPLRDSAPVNWSRLLASRWDAQHYIEIGLRGYDACKRKEELLPGEFPDDNPRCQLNFFPTYGFLGRWLGHTLGWAIDYALLAISVVASFVTIMLWTSSAVTKPLGVGTTYLALLLMNVFTTGFVLVTVQTEALFLAFTLATFYALSRRWLFFAALLAGAASSIRITGVAVGVAYSLALAALTWEERARLPVWILRAFYMGLSACGLAILMGFFQHRFGDALIYIHAHGRQYHHEASIAAILWPDTRLLMQSIWAEPNDGIWLVAALLWFSLGHRRGLERFDLPSQVFLYALFIGIVGISMIGSSEYGYGGLSRYLLCVPPLFFVMAAMMRRRPVVLAIWLYVSIAHYWGGNLCFYVGHQAPSRFEKCGFARSIVE